MNYCGIDLGGVSSYVYITTDRGRKLWSGPVETTKEAFEARLRRFRKDGLSVAIEAGNQTAWVYEALVAIGAKVTVVNPNKVKLIAESRRKTDKVDARILCELLRIDALPHPVHMPGSETRALRGLLGSAAAIGCRADQALQRGPRDVAARGASVAGRGVVELRRLGAGVRQQLFLRTRDDGSAGVLPEFQGFNAVHPRIGSEVGPARAKRTSCEAVADHAQGRTDRIVDVPGGGGRRASFSVIAETGGLLGPGADRAAEQRADGVRTDQPRRPSGVTGRVGANCSPGGHRSAPRHATAAELVQPRGQATREKDGGRGFGPTAVGNSVPLIARGNRF